jgi:hypothetical protein
LSLDATHEIIKTYIGRKWSRTNTKIQQRFLIFLEQKM